jgi:hypothetical protein
MELGVDRVVRLGDQRVDDVVELRLLIVPAMRSQSRLDHAHRRAVLRAVLRTFGSFTQFQ